MVSDSRVDRFIHQGSNVGIDEYLEVSHALDIMVGNGKLTCALFG